MLETIELDGAILKGLAKVAPTNDIRYYLNGLNIEVEQNHVTLVATDGHTIAAYRKRLDAPREREALSIIVPQELVKPLKPKGIVRLEIGEPEQTIAPQTGPQVEVRRVTLMQGGLEWRGSTIGHRYPDWRRSLGEVPNGEPTDINPHYVARLAACLDILTGAKSDGFNYHLHTGGARSNAWVTCDDPGFLGVIAPRIDAERSRLVPENHWGRNVVAELPTASRMDDDE